MNAKLQNKTNSGHALGLLAILMGIILGACLGGFYGRTMWLAEHGPQRKLQRLHKTVQQKKAFALRAESQGDTAEAARLRSHVASVQEEIRRTEADQREAAQTDLTLARHVSQLVRFCGEIFLRMLRLIVIPLVVTSMICGVSSLGDVRQMGKVGGWTLLYYLATTAAAVALGIFLLYVIEPGHAADDTFAYVGENVMASKQSGALATFLEVVRGREGAGGSGMIPSNIFLAAGEMNILGLIVFSLVFGAALSTVGPKGKPAIDLFHALNEAVMRIVRLIIYLTPIGVFGLVATNIADSGGGSAFHAELVRLGWFVATITVGLAIHTVVLCVILSLLTRRSPLRFLYTQAPALLTALSTDSSSATLPVTIQCAEAAGVSERAAGFVLPLGATINMNGTALYEAVAVIFIAQSAGIALGGTDLVIIFLIATFAAMGAPGIPNAGVVTLIIVLAAVNLPAAGIGTILAIDWFVDRERTVVNVFGDAVGAAVIDRYLDKGARPL